MRVFAIQIRDHPYHQDCRAAVVDDSMCIAGKGLLQKETLLASTNGMAVSELSNPSANITNNIFGGGKML